MTKPTPAFQFYSDEFLGGVIMLSAEERGVYITLLAMAWNADGVINAPIGRLAVACASTAEVVQAVLDLKFYESGGEWRNKRLEKVRLEQTAYKEQKSAAGKAGAAARWQSHGSRIDPPLPNDSPPPPSPSPRRIDIDIDFDRVDLEEVKRRANATAKSVGVKSRGDHVLCWQAAWLSVAVYSENWLRDSVEGVLAIKPKKPGAYFTQCLRNKAKECDRSFDADRKRVPPPPTPQQPTEKPPRARLKTADSVRESEDAAKQRLRKELTEAG